MVCASTEQQSKNNQQNKEHEMSTYSIHSSMTGEIIIKSIELPQDQVENLSLDNAEGHFLAGSLDELVEAGIDSREIVFAIVK